MSAFPCDEGYIDSIDELAEHSSEDGQSLLWPADELRNVAASPVTAAASQSAGESTARDVGIHYPTETPNNGGAEEDDESFFLPIIWAPKLPPFRASDDDGAEIANELASSLREKASSPLLDVIDLTESPLTTGNRKRKAVDVPAIQSSERSSVQPRIKRQRRQSSVVSSEEMLIIPGDNMARSSQELASTRRLKAVNPQAKTQGQQNILAQEGEVSVSPKLAQEFNLANIREEFEQAVFEPDWLPPSELQIFSLSLNIKLTLRPDIEKDLGETSPHIELEDVQELPEHDPGSSSF